MRPIVISLCDLTGNFVQPWLDAGYDAFLVDPQHETKSVVETEQGGVVVRVPRTVGEALPSLAAVIKKRDIAFVAGFPPCTDLSVSGARYHKRKMTDKTWKHYKGPNMFFDATRVAWQCEMVGQLSRAPWFVENPVSRLSTFWRKPDHIIQPYDYTLLEPNDNYKKPTCLWVGNKFKLPATQRDLTLGPPDDRIHKAPPGEGRGNFRSATPLGFSRAVFEANTC